MNMNVVLLGLLVPGVENIEGSIYQMLSHGIVSGALFFLVGAFYQRYKVRSLHYFGGFVLTAPILSTFFLIFSMANISFPGTSNFIGEFMICFGLYMQNSVVVILASINMVTGAAYTL
jgi:NADH-quinone oxidoreductase subunit M